MTVVVTVGASVVVTLAVPSGPLTVRLLGDLELRRGARVIALPPSRRTRALLAYLVATAAPQSRSFLCDLLWDGTDDPRASLRWSLTKLRALVDDEGAQRLVADREHVGFETRGCGTDLGQVDQLLAASVERSSLEALEAAAALLQAGFLEGLDLPACYRFHHWCMAERERLGALRRQVLETLVQRLRGEPDRALPYGRAMVAADPLAELSHATLVALLAASGHYPDAERHYAWARDLLQREVAMPRGGPLDEAIRQVRRELREADGRGVAVDVSAPVDVAVASPKAGSRATTSTPVPTLAQATTLPAPLETLAQASTLPMPQLPFAAPAEPMAAHLDVGAHTSSFVPPPLLGREAECAAIASRIGSRTSLPMLLFTGEPGIGKTCLLDHVAAQAAAAGRRVIRGRCFEAETVRPYGLLRDALRGLPLDGVAPATLERAAPLLQTQAASGGSRELLFDAAAALLNELAACQPLALVLDDLQWVDEASAALLHFLSRGAADDAAVLLVGAARAGDVDDNRAAKSLFQSMQHEGRLQCLELGPLGEAEARSLLQSAPLDAAEALRQSGGNPLYLIELARAAHRGDDASGRSVEALIDERLRWLDAADRELLGWAAAMGREQRADLLAAAAGLAVPEVLTRLERNERRGLIVATEDGRFDFAHDLVRQAVYRALSPPRRRAIHRQIASVLLAATAEEPSLHGEIVRHALLADDALAAARACLAAGEQCLQVFANAQAAQVAERGLAQIERLTPGPERVRLEIELLRLRVGAAAGPGGRRLPALAARIEGAVDAAEALALHKRAAAGWELLAFVRQQSGDIARAQQATLAAQAMTRRADEATHCRQLANSGRCLVEIEADPPRGRSLLDEAARLADALGLKVMEIEWGRGLVARADGALEAACDALSRAVALAHLAEPHWREVECQVWLATVEFERGRFDVVRRLLDDIHEAARRMGEPRSPFAQALGALARRHQGDAEAETDLAASLEALRVQDDKAHLAYALNEAAALALASGQRPLAAARAQEAFAAATAVRRATEVCVALAHWAAAERDPQRLAEAQGGAFSNTGATPTARSRGALDAAQRAIPTLASTAGS